MSPRGRPLGGPVRTGGGAGGPDRRPPHVRGLERVARAVTTPGPGGRPAEDGVADLADPARGPRTTAGLYARGVAGSIGAAAARRTEVDPDALPTTRLRRRGVRADADHLTAYQHLLGEPASDALPAGFVHVLAFPVALALMVRTDFPLPLLGMVHVANRVEQRRALRLGEELDVVARAEHLRPHRSGVTVDVVAEVGTAADGVVWTGTSTYLAKGLRLRGHHRPDAEERPPFDPGAPTGRWRLGADVGRRYAAVSGDRNPIHLSALAAKAFGFPRAIAHGMYTASRALADVGPARGEAFAWTVEFAAPVLLPGSVAVRVAPDDDGGHAFAAWHPRSGKPHLSGAVVPLD